MTESSAAVAWVYSRVAGIVGGQAYDSIAPQSTTGDYIIIQQQALRQIGTSLGGQRAACEITMQVKAITKGNSYAPAERIASAIDAAIEGQTGSAQGVTILSCNQEQQLRYTEVKEGEPYKHLGGIYKIVCQLQ